MTTGYCVRCKKKVDISNPIEGLTKRKVKIAKGFCPVCKTKVCRMGGI